MIMKKQESQARRITGVRSYSGAFPLNLSVDRLVDMLFVEWHILGRAISIVDGSKAVADVYGINSYFTKRLLRLPGL